MMLKVTIGTMCLLSLLLAAMSLSATEAKKVPKSQAKSSSASGDSGGTPSSSSSSSFPWKAGDKLIKLVTAQEFRTHVMDPTLPVVMMFFTPDSPQSKAVAPIFETVAKELKMYALFTAIDSSTEEGSQLGQMFGIQATQGPAIVLFNPEMFPVAGGQEGQYMKLPIAFQGAADPVTLSKWVLQTTQSHQIARIEDMQDLDVFLARYSHMDISKALLFTSQNVTSPMYKAASLAFRYGMLFGVVLPQAEDVHMKYNVESFPQVLVVGGSVAGEEGEFFPNARTTTTTDGEDENRQTDIGELYNFLEKHAFSSAKRLQFQSYFMQEEDQQRKKEAEEAKMNRALPPKAILSPTDWKQECLQRKKGFAVLVFLDMEVFGTGEIPSDFEEENNGEENSNQESSSTASKIPIKMLDSAAKKMAQRSSVPSQVCILDGSRNYELANFFEAANEGFPSVVYVHPAKKAFFNHIGSFTDRSIVTFFTEKATKLRGKTYKGKKIPEFKEPVVVAEEDAKEEGEEDAISDEM